jgi:hypothetical protein
MFSGNLVYFVEMWCILWKFGAFFHRFGMLYQEKSGSPELDPKRQLFALRALNKHGLLVAAAKEHRNRNKPLK